MSHVNQLTFASALLANAATDGASGSIRGGERTKPDMTETNMVKKGKSTDDETAAMVARLKESKARAEVDDRIKGIDSGIAYATRRASYRALQVIDAMAEEYGDPDTYATEDGAELMVETLAANLRGWYGEDHSEKELLDSMFPIEGRRRSPIFLASFVKTAAEMWREVAEQVG